MADAFGGKSRDEMYGRMGDIHEWDAIYTFPLRENMNQWHVRSTAPDELDVVYMSLFECSSCWNLFPPFWICFHMSISNSIQSAWSLPGLKSSSILESVIALRDICQYFPAMLYIFQCHPKYCFDFSSTHSCVIFPCNHHCLRPSRRLHGEDSCCSLP